MTTRFLYLSICLAALPLLSRAQGTVNTLENDFATRTTVTVDKKLAKGLHLAVDYQLRTENALSRIDRHQASLGLSYKFNNYFRGGLSYTFIYHNGASSGWVPRHRGEVFLTAGFRAGDWRFSLRETLQLTHRTGDYNVYQNTPNLVALKSRFKIQYKGFRSVEPYVFFELKNVLNDPAFSASWNTSSASYSNSSFLGYGNAYITRYRGALGLEWKIDNRNALEFYGLADYLYEKNIDANKTGTKLKSLTWDQTFRTTVGIGYKFSF